MPNLGLHIGFALEAANRLGHPLTQEHLGSYLLGCTAPDVRLYAGWKRERTHFFKLTTDSTGAGYEGLLQAHPHLRKSERLNRETVSFVLGYVSHLNTDETWIVNVYRRFFGAGAELAADPLCNVLDRVLQFELDRVERANIADLEGALDAIGGAYEGIDVGFIEPALLQEWRQVVIDRSGRELSWDRFQGFIKRVHPKADDDEIASIMAGLPALLEKVRSYVNDDEVRAFREVALDAFVSSATDYLNDGQVR
jgi:hypothetical protein